MPNFFKREFLYGLGSGLIISAMLVAQFGIDGLSDREIVERASKLGMVKLSQLPAEDIRKDMLVSTTNSSPPVDTNSAVYNNLSTSVDSVYKEAKDATTISKKNDDSLKTVELVIKPGMGSEVISKMLEEKGAVENQKAFYEVVTKHRAHTRFRTGTFVVPVGGDMNEIVKILTGKK